MTIDQLTALLQQFPGSTEVVLPKVVSNRHPKLASVSFYGLEYDEERDQYYEIDYATQSAYITESGRVVQVLILES